MKIFYKENKKKCSRRKKNKKQRDNKKKRIHVIRSQSSPSIGDGGEF